MMAMRLSYAHDATLARGELGKASIRAIDLVTFLRGWADAMEELAEDERDQRDEYPRLTTSQEV